MKLSNLACIIFHNIQELLICKSGFNLTKTLQKHLHSPDSDSKTFVILIFANVKSQKTKNFWQYHQFEINPQNSHESF